MSARPRSGRALTDPETEALSAKVVAAVSKATGGELRKLGDPPVGHLRSAASVTRY